MLALVILHAALALVAPATARRLGPRVLLFAAVAPAAAVAWALTKAGRVLDGEAVTERFDWVPELGVELAFRFDGFALLMVALVSGVGVLIFAYAAAYFSPRPGLGRFAGLLTAFSGAMLGLVLSDNLLLIYLFWELTSVTSYLLIGLEDEKGAARGAALQAILITGAGGLAMLGGFVLLGQAAGTYSLSGILADPPTGATVAPALVLVLLGAFTKSAQVPFHSWLPGAMAAPTPVSAYLHSATMVKAGVYLIARLAPAFAPTQEMWRPLVMTVGAATMLIGGLRALREHDLKLLLAHGTVSQLGFMVTLVGAGIPELTFAGAAVILAHGLFKAALFMVVGIVDHEAHSRDLRRLSGVGRKLPVTFVAAAAAVASMAGLPLLFGFAAKEAALEGLLDARLEPGGPFVVGAIVLGSAITVAYGARFLWGGFATKKVGAAGDDLVVVDGRDPGPLVASAVVLTVITVVLGVVPALATEVVGPAASALDPLADHGALYLWHGITVALGLSALAVGGGALLFAGRGPVERFQGRFGWVPGAGDAYVWLVTALMRSADRVTGIVQNGSLPVYLGVILLTVLALPGVALIVGGELPDEVVLAESPLQVAVAALVLAAAVGAALSHRRFVAVLMLGAIGFGVAALFLIQGAPDLALTQVLVETLALVIFVLVLRHLPERFKGTPWRLGRATRAAVALGMGVFVALFALVAAAARVAEPVSQGYLERSLPEAKGRNVVNVILVDFRGLDTLGEITVLTVAAIGIASLVLAARRGHQGGDGVDPMAGDEEPAEQL